MELPLAAVTREVSRCQPGAGLLWTCRGRLGRQLRGDLFEQGPDYLDLVWISVYAVEALELPSPPSSLRVKMISGGLLAHAKAGSAI